MTDSSDGSIDLTDTNNIVTDQNQCILKTHNASRFPADRHRRFFKDSTPSITSNDSSIDSKAFQEKIISLLSHIKTQNTQLLALLQNKEEILPLQDFGFQFPMKSLHDVDYVEQILKEKTQIDILNASLSTIGGRDVSSKVARILKYLFIDALAAKFSFYGKRLNKRPFSDLCLKSVIIDSIKRNTPGVNNKEIEDSIKIWLKHAPDREKNREKRRKQDE
ncbi:PREDICTED: uncharacterized protein LOC105565515 isoform X2 [Vollenhovia emeryi]|uniref:uncharacterized protein LOC105565515 isoform X2 n=1 Tax=Vollenhovia emeryi TaxID=411798 RepID=UPI0005F5056A|nr:PREDICTED: uncharacterized protein LOC105565515 isoform X2 [Vollenhovia emeryi]